MLILLVSCLLCSHRDQSCLSQHSQGQRASWTKFEQRSGENQPLQLCQNLLSTRNSDLAGALLVLSIGDFAMIQDHRPATVAISHPSLPAMVLREESFRVTQEQDIVTLDPVDLAPSIHDPAVIGCDDGNNVNSFLAELLAILDIWWKMVCLTPVCYSD
jgi:hypothetical protein